MKKNQILLITVLLFLFQLNVSSQESVVTAGGNTSSTSGSVSYSVGQVLYSTYIGNDASITEGIQHPQEAMILVSIIEIAENFPDIKLYPNPATDFIFLETTNELNSNLNYYLYNIEGKLLRNGKLTSTITSIPLKEFASSTYLLKIKQNNKEEITFKILKNQ